MRTHILWNLIAAVMAIAVGIMAYRFGEERKRADANEAIVERYDTLCRGVAIQLEIAIGCADRGDRAGARQAFELPPFVLNSCATTPIDLSARDACWIADNMGCLARELRDIVERLKGEVRAENPR